MDAAWVDSPSGLGNETDSADLIMMFNGSFSGYSVHMAGITGLLCEITLLQSV
ncbi:hypothetical protein GCM10010912_44060 [Paenibacillus albidus]|uniref:Uncharacterized protein n=1 Tax=Paenibacillus albidus TaxID=2041023 RepID=A0A917FP82_9BACL|nr:hypothetical protein GCM10010912_44060 [Paenibacillus albidus]